MISTYKNGFQSSCYTTWHTSLDYNHYRYILKLLQVRYKVESDACPSTLQSHTSDEEDEHQHVWEECGEVHNLKGRNK